MDPKKRKDLVLQHCHKPNLPSSGKVATQAQLDEWIRLLVTNGETDNMQICCAVVFIAKTHGLECELGHTKHGLKCIGLNAEKEYPALPEDSD